MSGKSIGILILIGSLGLTGCATTLKDSWMDPSVKPGFRFKKVVVAVLSRDRTTRRVAEDSLVSQIKRSEAVPSYVAIPEALAGDQERVKSKLVEDGFDGAVVMRIIGADQQVSFVPGSGLPARGFRGFYGPARAAAWSPGYLQTDTIVEIETNIYSLSDDKLVYTAHSETFNPADTVSTVGDIAKAIAKDLKKRGVLK